MDSSDAKAPDFQFRERSKAPSPKFLEVAQDIGMRIGLDPEKIIAGAAIEFKGVTFWLGQHTELDSNGLVVFIHMGDIAPEYEGEVFRRLLERNAITPAAIAGYYSVWPGTNIVAFCVRVDLATAAEPVDAILGYISLFAHRVGEVKQVTQEALEIIEKQLAEEEAAAS
jgi:hypothetical protein